MPEQNYCVYKHTSPSGKVYIGITSRKPEVRWRHNGSGYRENKYFTKAIRKYGWDNIDHKVLVSGISQKSAEDIERALIQKYKSNDMQYGYNLTPGGDGNSTKRSPETIAKMSAASIGNKHAKGSIRTEETRAKISASLMGKRNALGLRHTDKAKAAISAAHKGKKLSAEHRAKISAANKWKPKPGKNGGSPKSVLKMSSDGKVLAIFKSQIEAAMSESHGTSAKNKVSECCSGKRSAWHGFMWRYAEEGEAN